MINNRLNEYNARMRQSARGLQNFAGFFANQVCGNWQVTTTSQDVHDAFEFKRNAVKRDIDDSIGINVPPVSETNVPLIAERNVPLVSD